MKSESWPGWSLCLWRSRASISVCASSTALRETAEAMNMSILVVRFRSFMTVVYGAMTVSSWSCPIVLPPLVSRTPTTRKGMFLIRIIWSTAFPSGKSALATVLPRTATFAAERTSESPK